MAKIEPYGEFKELAPGLYCLEGEWQESVFRRRMTLVRLKSGGLFIHNAIQLRDEDYSRLEKLGAPQVIVAPNLFHGSDAPLYKSRYPEAKLWCSRSIAKALAKRSRLDGVLPSLDPGVAEEIACLELKGLRLLDECVFLHRSSKTLILTDLVFNVPDELKGIEKMFMRWNRIYQRFAPSRLLCSLFAKSKPDLESSLREILSWDFDRVIMNHGQVAERGGKEALRQSFIEAGILTS